MKRRTEAGGVTVEMTILAPLLILLLLLVVGFGRIVLAREQVDAAARDASRAASLVRSAGAASAAADTAARASLEEGSVSCRNADVTVDTSSFQPGGWVAVDVTCAVDMADLSLLRLPGSKLVHSRFVSTIDTYRATT